MKTSTLTSLIIASLVFVAANSLDAQQPMPLFDGQTLNGWTTQGGQAVTEGWEAIDGMLHLRTDGPRGGNIVTDREYTDFDLSFEWKIAPGGNNGVKYRVRNFDGKTLGCEYQMIDDDGYRQELPGKGATGSLYDIYEPNAAKVMNPVGQFNHSRIVVQGNRIEHWLNGQLIVTAHVGSGQWEQRIADSKFADIEGFGRNRTGKIMLTDHNSEVWYRNMQLTLLASPQACQPIDTHVKRPRVFLRRLFRRHR